MHFSKGCKHVLKSFVVWLKSFLNLKFIWLAIAFFDPLIELFWLTENHFDFWNNIDDVLLSEWSLVLIWKIVFLFKDDAQTQAKVSQYCNFTELKLKICRFFCQRMFKFVHGNYF